MFHMRCWITAAVLALLFKNGLKAQPSSGESSESGDSTNVTVTEDTIPPETVSIIHYETHPTFPTVGPPSTDTTIAEPTVTTERDTDPTENYEDFDIKLTPETLANLINGTFDMANYTEAELWKNNAVLAKFMEWEFHFDIRYFGDFNSFMRVCYYLATTYKNAIHGLRSYYPIRQTYVRTQEYELGYLSQEIVYKYQTVLELFHMIQRKYEQHPTRYFAPTSYMLFVYTNILHHSMGIIHLCNMMHEIKAKYKSSGKSGAFYDSDEKGESMKNRENEFMNAKAAAAAAYKKEREKEWKEQQKERQKERKLIEKGKFAFLSTRKATNRTTNRYWDIIYGWSIEYW